MKKAVVTGGAGFIGSHMVELLLKKRYHVTAIDDMSNGQQDNVEIFLENPDYKFLKVDLAGNFDDSIFKGVEYVFHMAALADIVPSIKEPVRYHNANVTSTNYCPKSNIRKSKKCNYRYQNNLPVNFYHHMYVSNHLVPCTNFLEGHYCQF